MIPVSEKAGLLKGLLLELEKLYPEEAKQRKKQTKDSNNKSVVSSVNNLSQSENRA